MNTVNFLAQVTTKSSSEVLNIPQVSGDSLFTDGLHIFFGIAGAVAVLMVVIGAIKFVYSQGDPQGAARARTTIIAAVVGLIISLAAFAIVSFIAGKL